VAGTANKTRPTTITPAAFLAANVKDAGQLADCRELVKLFREISGKSAKMWGPTIVGFGSYHYVYPSGREGDAPLIGFAPRGKEAVLYLSPHSATGALLGKLGKHRAGAGCVYIKALNDVDRGVLRKLAKASIAELRRRYPS
jgi:hypothetical protein